MCSAACSLLITDPFYQPYGDQQQPSWYNTPYRIGTGVVPTNTLSYPYPFYPYPYDWNSFNTDFYNPYNNWIKLLLLLHICYTVHVFEVAEIVAQIFTWHLWTPCRTTEQLIETDNSFIHWYPPSRSESVHSQCRHYQNFIIIIISWSSGKLSLLPSKHRPATVWIFKSSSFSLSGVSRKVRKSNRRADCPTVCADSFWQRSLSI